MQSATTDKEGRFNFAFVEVPAEYRLVVSGGSGFKDIQQDIQVTANTNEVDVVTEAFETGAVVGQLVNQNGFPIADFELVLKNVDSIEPNAVVRTDSQGNLAWEQFFGPPGTTDETGQDVVYLDDGSIVVLASADYYNTGTWLFKLGGNQLPTGSFAALPASPAAGEEVTFTVSGLDDPDGSVDFMT